MKKNERCDTHGSFKLEAFFFCLTEQEKDLVVACDFAHGYWGFQGGFAPLVGVQGAKPPALLCNPTLNHVKKLLIDF